MGFKIDRIAVLALVLCLAVVAGEAVVYGPPINSYSVDAELSGGQWSYEVRSSGSDAYSVVSVSDGGAPHVEHLCIYVDPHYRLHYEQAYLGSGAYGLDQEYYSEQIAKLAALRGFTDVVRLGPEGMKAYLEGTLEDPSSYALMVISYALPADVYAGGESDLAVRWVKAGGTLFWAGSEIGRYCVDSEGLHEVADGQSLFLGASHVNTGPRDSDRSAGQVTDVLRLRSSNLMFAASVDGVEGALALGYGDGEYYSIAMVPCGSGTVTVLGGGFDVNQLDDLGQILGAGITLKSTVEEVESGKVTRTAVSGTAPASDGEHLFIFIGGTYVRCGGAFYA